MIVAHDEHCAGVPELLGLGRRVFETKESSKKKRRCTLWFEILSVKVNDY